MCNQSPAAQAFSDPEPRAFVCYDLETSGLDTRRDQPLQLAAIRTDANLRESNQPDDAINARCDLAPGLVPSVGALLATRVQPRQLAGQSLTVHGLMDVAADYWQRWSQPRPGEGDGPVVTIGHNILRYDEQILRHQLWRSLHDPYVTLRYGLRADTLQIARAVAALEPGALRVPVVAGDSDEARLSFRLGDLTASNGIALAPDEAHDALADVRATLALAKLMRERAPSVWIRMMQMADKRYVLSLAGGPGEAGAGWRRGTPQLFLSYRDGRPVARAVLPLTTMYGKSWILLALDLAYDPSLYIDLDRDGLKLLANSDTSPFVSIASNRQPILWPLSFIQGELPVVAELEQRITQGRPTTAEALISERTERIYAAGGRRPGTLWNLVLAATAAMPPWPTAKGLEERLYGSPFPSAADRRLRDRIRAMPPAHAMNAIRNFEDPALEEWAWRRLLAEAPDELPIDIRQPIEEFLARRMITGDEGTRSISMAMAELRELQDRHADGPAETLAHLDAIEAFLMTLHDQTVAAAAIPESDPADSDVGF